MCGRLHRSISYFFVFIRPAVIALRQCKCFYTRQPRSYSIAFIAVPQRLKKILINAGLLERWGVAKLAHRYPLDSKIIYVLKPKVGENQ